jgi:hypothetical protein
VSWLSSTLGAEMFRLSDFWLETRSKFRPILDSQVALTNFHGDEAKKTFFFKFQNGRLKKTEFFKIANSQYFFVKILWIGPWVSRID